MRMHLLAFIIVVCFWPLSSNKHATPMHPTDRMCVGRGGTTMVHEVKTRSKRVWVRVFCNDGSRTTFWA